MKIATEIIFNTLPKSNPPFFHTVHSCLTILYNLTLSVSLILIACLVEISLKLIGHNFQCIGLHCIVGLVHGWFHAFVEVGAISGMGNIAFRYPPSQPLLHAQKRKEKNIWPSTTQ